MICTFISLKRLIELVNSSNQYWHFVRLKKGRFSYNLSNRSLSFILTFCIIHACLLGVIDHLCKNTICIVSSLLLYDLVCLCLSHLYMFTYVCQNTLYVQIASPKVFPQQFIYTWKSCIAYTCILEVICHFEMQSAFFFCCKLYSLDDEQLEW